MLYLSPVCSCFCGIFVLEPNRSHTVTDKRISVFDNFHQIKSPQNITPNHCALLNIYKMHLFCQNGSIHLIHSISLGNIM